jgi:NAD-dependent SIR2 family protein deacetylase
MPARCPHCANVVEENELPRMEGARVLCPQCQQPLKMPEMTVPFVDPKAVPTAPASKVSGGALSDSKSQHAVIAIDGTSARLEDLGSTNGTFVGEKRIEQAALEDRSEFRVGTHQLLFVMADRE